MNILLVEDEVALSNAVKKLLEQRGFFVDAVYDGVSAVDYATGMDYNLIILDVMLPKLDGFEVLRILRREDHEDMTGCVFVDDTQGAVAYLNGTQGNVLLTVGSKELAAYTAVTDWKNRLYARVLPLPASTQIAYELGFEGSRLICMQGPFTQEINEAMLRMLSSSFCFMASELMVEASLPRFWLLSTALVRMK